MAEAPQQTPSPPQPVPTASQLLDAGVQFGTGQIRVDITELLTLDQCEAAKRLKVPTSTLSKRWRSAWGDRRWPYRTLCKLDQEIADLVPNLPVGEAGKTMPMPPELRAKLTLLLQKHKEELRRTVIRL
jgi:hypothetical protein